MTILYVSYDGMLEPLGYSQVYKYLEILSKNEKIILVSYEKKNNLRINDNHKKLIYSNFNKNNILWIPLVYHKKLSLIATTYDLLIGVIVCFYLTIKYKINIIHARSYLASCIPLIIKLFLNIKFIFDMRGFWPDEKLESNWSANSFIYKFSKVVEKYLLLKADYIITLTNASVPLIKNFTYLSEKKNIKIKVIATCADLNIFRPSFSQQNFIVNKFVTIGYVGSIFNWYLFEETVKCFSLILKLKPNTKLLIINKYDHEAIRNKFSIYSISKENYDIISAEPYEMPNLIKKMDASVFFLKNVYSKQASSATKLGELLGCGIPCLTNSGVGDMEYIINSESVGVTVSNFTEEALLNGIDKLFEIMYEENIRQRCHNAALKFFSLEKGASLYRDVYHELNTSL